MSPSLAPGCSTSYHSVTWLDQSNLRINFQYYQNCGKYRIILGCGTDGFDCSSCNSDNNNASLKRTLLGVDEFDLVSTITLGTTSDIQLTYNSNDHSLLVDTNGVCQFGRKHVKTIEMKRISTPSTPVRITFMRDCTKVIHFVELADQTETNRKLQITVQAPIDG